MQYTTIDAETFAKMFLAGAKRLEAKKDIINELNVFPVPDGDTGTNMTLTIMSAAKELKAVEEMNMMTVAKTVSSGSLRGARGNSGVILSQLLRGFTKIIKENEELDIPILVEGLQKATETAYKAVMKPKEGTILTVAKACSDKAGELSSKCDDLYVFIKEVIDAGDAMLLKTPDMLPVLKEAGVVDSGGQGLMEILHGAYAFMIGEETLEENEEKVETEAAAEPEAVIYSAEFMIMAKGRIKNDIVNDIENALNPVATDIVCMVESNNIRIHVHSEDPGMALSSILPFGTLELCNVVKGVASHKHKIFRSEELNVKNDSNESVQPDKEVIPAEPEVKADKKAEDIKEEKEPVKNNENSKSTSKAKKSTKKNEKKEVKELKEMGFIAVSVGDGLDAIFKGLGVDYLISGGQTMNPSTDDMLKAIDNVDAKTVFILPNNKNIILAANQAQYLVEDKKVVVIPTKTTPQGITALINYMPDNSPEENEKNMNEEILKVKTGQVTYAVRDTVINGIQIEKGNIMGIGDHDILSVGNDLKESTIEMISKMVDDNSEFISIYYGADVEEEAANELVQMVEEKFSDCDVELHAGGQPIYFYIVSVE